MKRLVALFINVLCLPSFAQAVLSHNDAIRAIYGEYDPSTHTASGSLWHGNDDGVRRIKIEVLLDILVEQASGVHTYVVTSAVPEETKMGAYECHACAPEIGIGIFVLQNGAWKLKSSNPYADTFGANGHSPEVDLVRIGADIYAIKLSQDDMHGGEETDFSEFITASGATTAIVWSIMEHDDNLGDYDPKGVYGSATRIHASAAYRFVYFNSSDHYQIDVISRGQAYGSDSKIRQENWNDTYEFSGGKFVLIKRSVYKELPVARKRRP